VIPQREDNVWDLFERSPLAHAILDRRDWIKQQLRRKERKVWPTARVAWLFGVSERLLWKWIGRDIVPTYRRPTERHRKGITARAIKEFLRQLEECASFGIELRRERKWSAWERGKEEAGKLREDEELTPAQFAARAGISVATVYRLVADGVVHNERPTEHRIKICHWQRKYRRKPLTRKKSKKLK
jgi:hypothetical protein